MMRSWHMPIDLMNSLKCQVMWAAAPIAMALVSTDVSATGQCASVSPATCKFALDLNPGLNIDGPLQRDGSGRYSSRIPESEITEICRRFKSVRLTVAWQDPELTGFDGQVSAAMALSGQFNRAGCLVVIDHHGFRGFEPDSRPTNSPDQARQSFIRTWQRVAAAYSRTSGQEVALELLNEPSDKVNASNWNDIAAETVTAIRAAGFKGTLVIGPVAWNGPWALGSLRLPKDPDVITTVHIYEPMRFTHQGAEWMSSPPPSPVGCCTPEETAQLSRLLDQAQQWAENAGRPLFVGEYGVYQKAPAAERNAYLVRFNVAARTRNIPVMIWEYDRGFGIFDRKTRQWNVSMLSSIGITEK